MFFRFFLLEELLFASNTEFDKARHLAWCDMAMDSQTNQFGQGTDIILGRTGLDLCPVAAVLGYVVSRAAQHSPFFITSSRKPSPIRGVYGGVWTLLGFPIRIYTRHSFHIEAATTAALAGVRFHHPATGEMAECGIPAIYPQPTGETDQSVPHSGSPGTVELNNGTRLNNSTTEELLIHIVYGVNNYV